MTLLGSLVLVGLVAYLAPIDSVDQLVRLFFSPVVTVVVFVGMYWWKRRLSVEEVLALLQAEGEEREKTLQIETEHQRAEVNLLKLKRPEITLSEQFPDLPGSPVVTTTEVPLIPGGSHKFNRTTVLVSTPYGTMSEGAFQTEFIMQVRNSGEERAEDIEIDLPDIGGVKVTFDIFSLDVKERRSILSRSAQYRDGHEFWRGQDFLLVLQVYARKAGEARVKLEMEGLAKADLGPRTFPLTVTYNDRRGNRYVDYYYLAYFWLDEPQPKPYRFEPDGRETYGPDGQPIGPPALRRKSPLFEPRSNRRVAGRPEENS